MPVDDKDKVKTAGAGVAQLSIKNDDDDKPKTYDRNDVTMPALTKMEDTMHTCTVGDHDGKNATTTTATTDTVIISGDAKTNYGKPQIVSKAKQAKYAPWSGVSQWGRRGAPAVGAEREVAVKETNDIKELTAWVEKHKKLPITTVWGGDRRR